MSKIMIGKHEGTIYPEGNGFTGAIDLEPDATGRRRRIKRKGRTKEAVKDKLIKAVEDLDKGIETSNDYTVTEAVRDWFKRGTKGRAPNTVTVNRNLAEKNLIPRIGGIKLKRLSADDVDDWLDGLTDTLSTASLLKVHSVLKRSIRQAQARDKVARNVAELVKTPKGRAGRPSKALTLDQATAVLAHAKASPLYAYVAVSLLTGVRTEEARALRWSHVVAWVEDAQEWRPVTEAGFGHKRFAVYVWRSVRADGDTKTELSRRTLELPDEAADALRDHHKGQAARRLRTGAAWQDNDLVFCTRTGTPLLAGNVRRSFRAITKAAETCRSMYQMPTAGLRITEGPTDLPLARCQGGSDHPAGRKGEMIWDLTLVETCSPSVTWSMTGQATLASTLTSTGTWAAQHTTGQLLAMAR